MNTLNNLTALIINYKTYDLTKQCVESLLQAYPTISLMLIDNGSNDESTHYIKALPVQYENITVARNKKNIYHGPAMDQGIRQISTQYVFILDSDCKILRSGFLEKMLALFANKNLYAAGKLIYMNRYGYQASSNYKNPIKYIHPYAMLLDREKYLTLKPFTHHGSPCIYNMKDAERTGYQVYNFPLTNFVYHLGKGTCNRYGYALSVKTSIERLLNDWGIFA